MFRISFSDEHGAYAHTTCRQKRLLQNQHKLIYTVDYPSHFSKDAVFSHDKTFHKSTAPIELQFIKKNCNPTQADKAKLTVLRYNEINFKHRKYSLLML